MWDMTSNNLSKHNGDITEHTWYIVFKMNFDSKSSTHMHNTADIPNIHAMFFSKVGSLLIQFVKTNYIISKSILFYHYAELASTYTDCLVLSRHIFIKCILSHPWEGWGSKVHCLETTYRTFDAWCPFCELF